MRTALVTATILTLLAPALFASELEGISGTASRTIELRPQVLRMEIDLMVQARTTGEAAAQLAQRQDAARAKLTELGAPEGSIQIGQPRVGSGADAQMAMMRRMGRQQPQAQRQPSVTLSSTIRAEWPLPDDEGLTLLVEAHDLETKISEADIAGMRDDAAALRAAEEMEEMGMMMGGWGDGPIMPGQPRFTYAAPLGDDQRQQASAEAFQSAREHALATARAAGVSLGALRQVTIAATTEADDMETRMMRRFMPAGMRAMMAAGEPPATEATSPTAGPVKWQVTVVAVFAIE